MIDTPITTPTTEQPPLPSNSWVRGFYSSNVRRYRYNPSSATLDVQYKGKKGAPDTAYRYWNVSVPEAIAMHAAASKGTWVWDSLRIRGSRTLHRKPYAPIPLEPDEPIVVTGETNTNDTEPPTAAQ